MAVNRLEGRLHGLGTRLCTDRRLHVYARIKAPGYVINYSTIYAFFGAIYDLFSNPASLLSMQSEFQRAQVMVLASTMHTTTL